MTPTTLDFNDTEIAFRDKSDAELRQRHLLFRSLNSQGLVDFGAMSAALALKIGLPIKPLIKATVFKHFCGGETLEECEPAVTRLGRAGIGTILDYAIEGKEREDELDATRDELLRNIDRARLNPHIPFAVFKVTGLARFALLERIGSGRALSAAEEVEYARVRERVENICEQAAEIGQPVLIDAEESWIQDAIDRLAEEMMTRFNTDNAIVYHTVQLYRKDRLAYLKESVERVTKGGSRYGVKLVRGAYLEKEREHAVTLGRPSPVHERLEDTAADFDSAVEFCLSKRDRLSFVAATHNEAATRRLVERMAELGLSNDDPSVHFSQLFGMSDNLSYVLAHQGFNVSKYLPYGPVEDAIPYLTRRARENSSVKGQASRELTLIEKELKRRREC
jgi:proline dehydrogenase